MSTTTVRPLRPEVLRGEPVDRNLAEQLAALERLANLMDTAFEVPGLGIRFGLDALIGLVPGLGDLATSLVSLYIVAAARRFGVGRATLARMGVNVAIDWLLGSLPVIGDLFDVAWKANRMNVTLLRRHLLSSPQEQRRARSADWFFVAGLLAVLILLICGATAALVIAVKAIWGLFG